MKSLIPFIALFAALQYRLWFGEGSLRALWALDQRIAQQEERNAVLASCNMKLAQKIASLKSGGAAVEAYARENLNMIRKGEVFYQFLNER